MKKLHLYDWVAILAGGLTFLLYLFYVLYSVSHFQSASSFVETDQSDMAAMNALTSESQLIGFIGWMYPYCCAIALILLVLTKRYWFLALYAGLSLCAFATGVLLYRGYWMNYFMPLMDAHEIAIVIALYFVAKLVLVIRKEKAHIPDKVTVFAKRIHEERLAHHLTQEEVAEKLHMSRSTVSRLETGVTPPVEETIAAFAQLFEIPEGELTDVPVPLGEEDERAFAMYGLLLSLGYAISVYGVPLVFAGVIYSAWRRFSRSLIVFGIIVLLLSLVIGRIFLPALLW